MTTLYDYIMSSLPNRPLKDGFSEIDVAVGVLESVLSKISSNEGLNLMSSHVDDYFFNNYYKGRKGRRKLEISSEALRDYFYPFLFSIKGMDRRVFPLFKRKYFINGEYERLVGTKLFTNRKKKKIINYFKQLSNPIMNNALNIYTTNWINKKKLINNDKKIIKEYNRLMEKNEKELNNTLEEVEKAREEKEKKIRTYNLLLNNLGKQYQELMRQLNNAFPGAYKQ